jgi:hypothetical protein
MKQLLARHTTLHYTTLDYKTKHSIASMQASVPTHTHTHTHTPPHAHAHAHTHAHTCFPLSDEGAQHSAAMASARLHPSHGRNGHEVMTKITKKINFFPIRNLECIFIIHRSSVEPASRVYVCTCVRVYVCTCVRVYIMDMDMDMDNNANVI